MTTHLDNFPRLDVDGNGLGPRVVVQRLLAQHKLAGFSHRQVAPRHSALLPIRRRSRCRYNLQAVIEVCSSRSSSSSSSV